MIFQLKDVQEEFKRVEKLFQREVPETETMPEAKNGGYKAMLKAYTNLEDTAFEVLYDEETETTGKSVKREIVNARGLFY